MVFIKIVTVLVTFTIVIILIIYLFFFSKGFSGPTLKLVFIQISNVCYILKKISVSMNTIIVSWYSEKF